MHDPAAGAAADTCSETPLRSARRAAGLTQAALAARVGRTQSWIAYVENGTFPLRLGMAARIAAALGVPVAMVVPDATFHCQRLHCGLPVGDCLARQLRNQRWNPPRNGTRGETARKRGRADYFPSSFSALKPSASAPTARPLVSKTAATFRHAHLAAACGGCCVLSGGRLVSSLAPSQGPAGRLASAAGR